MQHVVIFTLGLASAGQERIWLDERVRFYEDAETSLAIYNVPCLFAMAHGTLMLDRLCLALKLLIRKHPALGSAVRLDENGIQLRQYLPHEQDNSEQLFSLIVSKVTNTDEVEKIVSEEESNRALFNVTQGRILRCHVMVSDDMQQEDLILINVHHIAFDGFSVDLLHHDLQEAYQTGELHILPSELQYIDYSIHENLMDMSNALSYWKNNLSGYDIEPHGADSNKAITGHGCSVEFELSNLTSQRFIAFAQNNNATLFQLGLSVYFAFLFKISDSYRQDLLIGTVIANRYRHELTNIIGMFANTLPLRLQLNPNDSFVKLLVSVKNLVSNAFQYGYVPYQRIIEDLVQLRQQESTALVRNVFTMESVKNFINRDNLSSTPQLRWLAGSGNTDYKSRIAKFELNLTLEYDIFKSTIRGAFQYSCDRWKPNEIEIITRRFSLFIDYLFSRMSIMIEQPIYTLNVLQDEEKLMLRQLNDAYIDKSIFLCNHQMFANQAGEHPQKLAMTLEQQCLTYAETLHYSQHLAKYLIGNEVICQLLERSIEMIIGMFAIWMSGGIYTPLNPRDPLSRIELCIKKIRARLILVHDATNHILPIEFPASVINIEHIISSTSNNDDHDFSTVLVTSQQLSHIVFTSGSTGTPKAVSLLVFENRESRIDEVKYVMRVKLNH
ncbi:unnamed protein product [Rotaria socialis]|uniref:Condensation domain-containing protein n=1 Tax=Rotaria socialis TaxID=392032 RepID=A0A821W0Q3_9BILA|nr:unnamed protein product [Rotaria socialis]CAF4916444.1 unnamed protein product [Rotaria socialis]